MAKGNRGAKSPHPKKENATRRLLNLSDRHADALSRIGNGDRTKGAEIAADLLGNSPLFYRIKQYLESRDDDVARSLLLDMEDYEIERIYEEAIAEGVIKLPTGSWII